MKIWVDLDNTPHVPLFVPIINELEHRGYKVVLTARDAFQVCELADKMGIHYIKIGRHYGKNPIMKIIGLVLRSTQLLSFYLRQRPTLALSHGSRSQVLLCNMLRIPTIIMDDYEHSRTISLARPTWMIVPDSIFISDSPQKLSSELPLKAARIRHYRGIKEDVYVPNFRPDKSILDKLRIALNETIVTVRPPANEAHYYNPESDLLLIELMARICQTSGIRAILMPRNRHQEKIFRTTHPDWFADSKTIIPPCAVDGLNLIWFSDFIVSGGGTMNREAAALGIPVYSIFRGKIGAVDSRLEREGRLILIKNVDEVWAKIKFIARDKNREPDNRPRAALQDIIRHIEDIIRIEETRSLNK